MPCTISTDANAVLDANSCAHPMSMHLAMHDGGLFSDRSSVFLGLDDRLVLNRVLSHGMNPIPPVTIVPITSKMPIRSAALQPNLAALSPFFCSDMGFSANVLGCLQSC